MISGVLIVCICIFVYHSFASGTTLQSREQLLENAIANGNHWRILKETKIEDALISAAYSTDDQIALVVFVPTFFGGYQVETTTRCHADDIMMDSTRINGNFYDFIWFYGAQTEYAEITYTVDGQEKDPIWYDTSNMDILYCKNTAKEYSIHVSYYDQYGNCYES